MDSNYTTTSGVQTNSITNVMKKIIIGLCLLFSINSFAVTLTATTNGNWATAATWGGITPVAGDDFIIPSGITVTLNATTSANSVTINTGGTLTFGAQTLTVATFVTNSGTITFTTGTLNVAGDFTNNGTLTAGTGNVNFDATALLNHTQNIGGTSSTVFHTLTIDNLGATNDSVLLNSSISTTNLTITAGVLGTKTNTITGSATGTCQMSAGTSLLLGLTNSTTIIPLPVFKVYTLAATSTIDFQSDGAQTIPTSITYGSLTICAGTSNPTNVLSSTTNFIITGNLTIGNGASTGVTLQVSTNAITVDGNTIINTDGILSYTGAGILSVQGNFTNNNSAGFVCGTSTVLFSGTAAQNQNQMLTSTSPFYNLSIDNLGATNNSVILGSAITIANGGNLTLTKGILDVSASNYLVTIDGNFTNNLSTTAFNAENGIVNFGGGSYSATIKGTSSTTFYNINCNPGTGNSVTSTLVNETASNAVTVNSGSLNIGAKTLTVAGSGTAVTVNNGGSLLASTGALTLSSASGSVLNNGDITFSGAGTLNAAGLTNNDSLTGLTSSVSIAGSVTNTGYISFSTGKLTTTANGNLTNSGTGTMLFSSTGNLSVSGNTTISGGSITMNNGTFTSTGNLTITGGLTFIGAGNLNIAGNFINNGAFSAGTSIVTFDATALQNQNQLISGSSSTSFYSLYSSNLGTTNDTVKLGQAITIDNNLDIMNGVFACTTYTITGPISTGTIAMGANTYFLLGLTTSTTSVPFPAFLNSNFNASSTVVYQSDGPEVISTYSYANLDLFAGTHNPTYTIANTHAFTIAGNFLIGNGSSTGITLSISSNAITVVGNVTIGSDGLLSYSGAGVLSIEGNLTSNNNAVSAGFSCGTSTVSFASTAALNHNQTFNSVKPMTFYTFSADNVGTTNNTVLLNQAIKVNNALSVVSGTLACQTNAITGPGAAAGTFQMSAGSNLLLGLTSSATIVPLPVFKTNTLSATSTINFQCDGVQTIPTSLTYGNVNIYAGSSNPTNVLSSTTSFTIAGKLTVGSGTSTGVKLQISTNTVTVGGNTVIASDGTILFTGAGGLKIAGNFTNNGVFTASTSTITFNGAVAQTIGGTTSTTFNNLTLNNSKGLTESTSETVNNVLALTSGHITLGAFNLNLGSAASVTGAGASNYVITNGAGTLSKVYNTTGTFNFPVGDVTAATDYSPLSLNLTAGTVLPATINVTTTNSKEPNNNSATSYLNRYWTVTSSLTTLSCNFQGTYLVGDVAGTESAITSGLWTGSTPWNKYNAVNTASHYVSGTITSFGDITGITAASPTVSITPTTVCSSSPIITANAVGDPTFKYSWSTTATTSSITIATPGSYSVTVTDGNGFTATNTVTVAINTPAIGFTSAAGTNAQTVCNNSPVTNITYTVDPGTTGTTVTGLPPGVAGSFLGNTCTISGTPTASGNYTYTVTTVGPCTPQATATGTLTILAQPAIALSSATGTDGQTVCNKSSISNITYVVSGTATGATLTGSLPPGVNGLFGSGTFAITGTPTVSGVYSYTVTTTGGSCSPQVSASGTITVDSLPAISLFSANGTDGQTVCNTNAITDIKYLVSGTPTGATLTGSLPPGVNGSFSSGTFTISGIPTISGIYSYTVTTTGGSCSPQVSLNGTITVDSLPTISLSSANGTDGQEVCNNSSITDINYLVSGTATGATLTGSLPAGVNGSFGSDKFTISGTPTISGIYSYTVTTTGGSCSPQVSLSGTITVDSLPTISLSSAVGTDEQTVCNTNAIADIKYLVSGTPTGATLTGSLPPGVNGSFNSDTFIISGTPTISGVYSYTVTTTGGSCSPQVSLNGTITVDSLPTLTLTSGVGTDGQIVCNNSAITNITYVVSGTATGATLTGTLPTGVNGSFLGDTFTITGTPTVDGVYTYTITTTGGSCSPQAVASGTLTISTQPAIALSSASGTDGQTVCNTNAITDIKYLVSGTPTGATLTGSLPAGVTGSYSGSTFTITGTPTISGVYSYTVTTTGGSCSPQVSLSGTITVDSLPTLTLTSAIGTDGQTVCNNSNITNIIYSVSGTATGATLTGSLPAGVTGSFSSSTFTITGTPTVTGVYTYTITSTGGSCSPAATVNGTITVNPIASISLSSASGTDGQTVCNNTAITDITYSVDLGSTNAVLTGALPTGVSGSYNSSTNVYTITGTPTVSGNYTYTVTTSGSPCGTASASGTINVNALPSVSISGNVIGGFTICSGNNDTLTASASGGSGSGYIFTWSDGSSTANDIETTAATYSVTVIDGNGCSNTASQAVTVNATPTVTVTPDAPGLCTGGSVNMNAGGATSYTWSPATGLNLTTGSSVNANPTSTQTYTIVGTTGSCSANQTATVTVATTLTVTVTPSAPAICLGNSVTLNGNGASSFTWKAPGGLSCTSCPSPSANPSVTTTYTVVGTSGTCADSANVVVTVNTLPSVTVSDDKVGGSVICSANDTLTATASGHGAFTYIWNTGVTTSTLLVDTAGTYTVKVTDVNGCVDSVSQAITKNNQSITITGVDSIPMPGVNDTLTAHNGTNYNWSTGSTTSSVIVAPTTLTTYQVTGTDPNGCHDTATFTVKVGPNGVAALTDNDKTSLYPNPAERTINMSFEMQGAAKAAIIRIYDAYGKEVMNTSATISNGKVLPIDISSLDQGLYFIKVTTEKNTQVIKFVKQ